MLKCKANGCKGVARIDKKKAAALRTGCEYFEYAYPCNKCGKLHFASGHPVIHRFDKSEVFLIKDNLVFKKDGKEVKYDS
jgi:hypothetical protein